MESLLARVREVPDRVWVILLLSDRRYGGRRVVYVRERVREPRYEFKELPRGTRPANATMVEYRRRAGATDQRRPDRRSRIRTSAAVAHDDRPSAGGSAATRPGDDIRDDRSTSGRRRATELDRDEKPERLHPFARRGETRPRRRIVGGRAGTGRSRAATG